MRRWTVGLLCLIFGINCNQEQKRPYLIAEPRKLALGSVNTDTSYAIRYVIKNSGDADLLIDTATASCDCTIPVLGKSKLLPGDTTLLLVNFRPPDTGYFDKRIVIRSNSDSVFTIVSFYGVASK
jgi:hypothetical protein